MFITPKLHNKQHILEVVWRGTPTGELRPAETNYKEYLRSMYIIIVCRSHRHLNERWANFTRISSFGGGLLLSFFLVCFELSLQDHRSYNNAVIGWEESWSWIFKGF